MHPPSDDALAALDSDDPGEAAEKRALLEIQNASDADLLDQLRAAEEDLEVQRQLAEAASQRAEEKQAAAGDRLAELTEARDLQSAYAEQVEARLEHSLSEAAALAELDANLSAEIRAEQAARRRAGSPRGRRRHPGRPPAVVVAAASGSGGGSLNPSLGSAVVPRWRLDHRGQLDRRLAPVDAERGRPRPGSTCAAAATGPSDGQIQTRMNNCGTSYYAIYEMPASQCHPPTARPGQSMHERGLAVDFTCNGGGVIGSHSSPCFQWLAANASGYGFYNLPSEPWHWSTQRELSFDSAAGGRLAELRAPPVRAARHVGWGAATGSRGRLDPAASRRRGRRRGSGGRTARRRARSW